MNFLKKRRLKIREISPVNDCSVISVSKLITSETKDIPSQYSSQKKFIPFIRERDAIGRLIITESVAKFKLDSSIQSLKPSQSKSSIKAKLTKKKYRGDIPPVGYYKIEDK